MTNSSVCAGLSAPAAVAAVGELLLMINYGITGTAGPMTHVSLQQPLQHGASITVEASSEKRGAIDLMWGNDIVLHVDCRFNYTVANSKSPVLVLNTRHNGIWHQNPKRPDNYWVELPLPISAGVKSVITIVYENSGYRLFIDDEEQYFYKHRLCVFPTHLYIEWDKIYSIKYTNSGSDEAKSVI